MRIVISCGVSCAVAWWALGGFAGHAEPITGEAPNPTDRQQSFLIPNLGQWEHPARFVHRSHGMTLFVEDRGWVVDLRGEERGACLRMTFEGEASRPPIVGERPLAARHHYFLGDDPGRWRAEVPLYSSVRFEDLYPDIDMRLRFAGGHRHPEYDLLLTAGAELSRVVVHVAGADRLRVAEDGSLVVETAAGDLVQPAPRTWEVDRAGRRHPIDCRFRLLGPDRFGFVAPDWTGFHDLVIDPGLVWSTYLGGNKGDGVNDVVVEVNGTVTVVGQTSSADFPTTLGAYDRTHNKGGYSDLFVTRLDATGSRLVSSTYLGGRDNEWPAGIRVATDGTLTFVGTTWSTDFPTTANAYDRTLGGRSDTFVATLDPSRSGAARLRYSSLFGGSNTETARAFALGQPGVVTITGSTYSKDLPTTPKAYARTPKSRHTDVFVATLDTTRKGSAQLAYATYLGGLEPDVPFAVAVNPTGVVTVGGSTGSADWPTTSNAYDRTYNHGFDAFLSRLDPRASGSAQLTYSTFLGGKNADGCREIHVDASGVVTFTGHSQSPGFPTTAGAFDRSINGNRNTIVCRLDPAAKASAQLLYSTFLGGNAGGEGLDLAVAVDGTITVAGHTHSANFPTTPNAFDRTLSATDAFVARFDPRKTGAAQLIYSTFFGGPGNDVPGGVSVDPVGVATIAGAAGPGMPTTAGAFDRTFNSIPTSADGFVCRIDMGIPFRADRYELSTKEPGSRQRLTLDAGKPFAGARYWIFGSITGTAPGVTLNGVNIPLVPDVYTDLTISAPTTSPPFTGFRGTLDANGTASATFTMPRGLPPAPGVTLHHACLVYENVRWRFASNAVPLQLK